MALTFDLDGLSSYLSELRQEAEEYLQDDLNQKKARALAVTMWHVWDWVYSEHGKLLGYSSLPDLQHRVRSCCPEFGYLQDIGTARNSHFIGPLAIDAFNRAGGRYYSGHKVPLENMESGSTDTHWRESVVGEEIMSPFYNPTTPIAPLSEISVQALADIGYVVDASQADPYRLPPAGKPVAAGHLVPYDDHDHPPPGIAP